MDTKYPIHIMRGLLSEECKRVRQWQRQATLYFQWHSCQGLCSLGNLPSTFKIKVLQKQVEPSCSKKPCQVPIEVVTPHSTLKSQSFFQLLSFVLLVREFSIIGKTVGQHHHGTLNDLLFPGHNVTYINIGPLVVPMGRTPNLWTLSSKHVKQK